MIYYLNALIALGLSKTPVQRAWVMQELADFCTDFNGKLTVGRIIAENNRNGYYFDDGREHWYRRDPNLNCPN